MVPELIEGCNEMSAMLETVDWSNVQFSRFLKTKSREPIRHSEVTTLSHTVELLEVYASVSVGRSEEGFSQSHLFIFKSHDGCLLLFR